MKFLRTCKYHLNELWSSNNELKGSDAKYIRCWVGKYWAVFKNICWEEFSVHLLNCLRTSGICLLLFPLSFLQICIHTFKGIITSIWFLNNVIRRTSRYTYWAWAFACAFACISILNVRNKRTEKANKKVILITDPFDYAPSLIYLEGGVWHSPALKIVIVDHKTRNFINGYDLISVYE